MASGWKKKKTPHRKQGNLHLNGRMLDSRCLQEMCHARDGFQCARMTFSPCHLQGMRCFPLHTVNSDGFWFICLSVLISFLSCERVLFLVFVSSLLFTRPLVAGNIHTNKSKSIKRGKDNERSDWKRKRGVQHWENRAFGVAERDSAAELHEGRAGFKWFAK